MEELLYELSVNPILKLVCLACLSDALFGILRAIKQRKLNSSFGIDGLIRKIAIVFCILILFGADTLLNLNLAPFLSHDVLKIVKLESIGLTEVFGMLFVAFETLSILKNLTLLGLPLPKGLKSRLEKWFIQNTDENSVN